MNLDIDILKRDYFPFDKEIPYITRKKQQICIYPILTKDSNLFLSCIDILNINKNEINNLEVIQMSYLQFICNVLFEDKNNIVKFINLLELCFRVDSNNNDIKYYKDEKDKMVLNIKGVDIDSKDFDSIKKIILYQNLSDYDDEYISPELKKVINDYYSLRNSNIEYPNIENQIAIIQAHNGMRKQDLLNMTYRSFKLLFDSVVREIDYIINKTASMSGFCKFEKPIEHFAYKPKKNKYADVFMSSDKFKEKIKPIS